MTGSNLASAQATDATVSDRRRLSMSSVSSASGLESGRLLNPSPEPRGLQQAAARALESPTAHWAVLSLVLMDLVIVLIEIGFSLFNLDQHIEQLWWFKILHFFSMAILVAFVGELVAKLLVFGWSYFLYGKEGWIHSFDALVVWLSLVVELALQGRQRELFSLLIILRLWRIVRVIDGVALTVQMSAEVREHELHLEIDRLRREVMQLRRTNRRLEGELRSLRARNSPVSAVPTTPASE
ncbi:hypothetical protein IWQ60_000587 [Tieghemiomyces parasiticus]|uniref:Hydrogen voltage-gated channel 1 n=1 Tax=Tieghemiomyces parasiticus TaxID=78921 RepID=A0A9W8E2L7_9FUNG|nr:hypothetical protein IWQ60_000587 [Tieghemiomyces parasiticus]